MYCYELSFCFVLRFVIIDFYKDTVFLHFDLSHFVVTKVGKMLVFRLKCKKTTMQRCYKLLTNCVTDSFLHGLILIWGSLLLVILVRKVCVATCAAKLRFFASTGYGPGQSGRNLGWKMVT